MINKHSNPGAIDKRVILTMIVCMVCGVMVLAFRYKSSEPDATININVKSGALYAGEAVRFVAQVNGILSKKLTWDFGDRSRTINNNVSVNHVYTEPGRYDVILTVNNSIKEYKTIIISEAPVVEARSQVMFSGPNKAVVGMPVTFKDTSANAIRWEWCFGESSSTDATTQQAAYRFKTPGIKKVMLTVNGTMRGELMVNVEERRESKQATEYQQNGSKSIVEKDVKLEPDGRYPPPAPLSDPGPIKVVYREHVIKVQYDTDESRFKYEFESLLLQVIDRKKFVGDFSQYVCNPDIPVNYNGREITFSRFCNELSIIRNRRRLKSCKIKYEKDDDSNCIKKVTASISYETFWSRILSNKM